MIGVTVFQTRCGCVQVNDFSVNWRRPSGRSSSSSSSLPIFAVLQVRVADRQGQERHAGFDLVRVVAVVRAEQLEQPFGVFKIARHHDRNAEQVSVGVFVIDESKRQISGPRLFARRAVGGVAADPLRGVWAVTGASVPCGSRRQ